MVHRCFHYRGSRVLFQYAFWKTGQFFIQARLPQQTKAGQTQSKPPVNWWYAQALEGPNTDLVPKGTKKFDTALQFRAAAEAAVLFCLFILATRKRVYVLFHCHLILCVILFQLVLYVFFNRAFISTYRIHKVPSGPKVSAPIFVL